MKLEEPNQFWSLSQQTTDQENDTVLIISPNGYVIRLKNDDLFEFIYLLMNNDSGGYLPIPGEGNGVWWWDGPLFRAWVSDPWNNAGFEKTDIVGSVEPLLFMLKNFLCKTTTIPLYQ